MWLEMDISAVLPYAMLDISQWDFIDDGACAGDFLYCCNQLFNHTGKLAFSLYEITAMIHGGKFVYITANSMRFDKFGFRLIFGLYCTW